MFTFGNMVMVKFRLETIRQRLEASKFDHDLINKLASYKGRIELDLSKKGK